MDPNAPTPKPKPTKAPTPLPQLAEIGEQIQAGNWLFTVTGVQYHMALYLYDNLSRLNPYLYHGQRQSVPE